MEVQKRKIFLEDNIDRTFDSPTWGSITASTFYVNVFLTQTIDDMGLFTDMEIIPSSTDKKLQPNYSLLINKLSSSGITFPFMSGSISSPLINLTDTDEIVLRMPDNVVSDYYEYGNLVITGNTDSKIDDVQSYAANNKYRIGFNTSTETYRNYLGNTITGVDRIKSMGNPRIYVFDTQNDINLGTNNQTSGIQYLEYTGETRNTISALVKSVIPVTTFRYIGEGWNQTNTSLSAITKEEYLFGIISPPEVQSDVFIERGKTTVMGRHLRLSEISNLGELSRYGNGYYKLNKQ